MELSEESESKKSLESLDIFAFQCTIYPLRSTTATNLRGKGTQCDVTNNLAADKLSPSLWDKFEGKLRVF